MGPDKVLCICIDSDELCPVDTFFHHAGDRIRTPPTTADNGYLGLELGQDLVKIVIIL